MAVSEKMRNLRCKMNVRICTSVAKRKTVGDRERERERERKRERKETGSCNLG
jgi:hypothetical protein